MKFTWMTNGRSVIRFQASIEDACGLIALYAPEGFRVVDKTEAQRVRRLIAKGANRKEQTGVGR